MKDKNRVKKKTKAKKLHVKLRKDDILRFSLFLKKRPQALRISSMSNLGKSDSGLGIKFLSKNRA